MFVFLYRLYRTRPNGFTIVFECCFQKWYDKLLYLIFLIIFEVFWVSLGCPSLDLTLRLYVEKAKRVLQCIRFKGTRCCCYRSLVCRYTSNCREAVQDKTSTGFRFNIGTCCTFLFEDQSLRTYLKWLKWGLSYLVNFLIAVLLLS